MTQHSIEFVSGHEDRAVMWGGQNVTVRLARRVRKPLPEGEWLRQELPLLPCIAAAARGGRITLFRGGELAWEANHARQVFFEGPASPFQGLTFHGAVPPFDYTRLLLSYDDQHAESHARQKAFFEGIRHPRFLEILSGIGQNKLADAFHLWTAEHNQMDFFLTTDRKLINAVLGSHVSVNVRVVGPGALAEALGLPC